MRNNLILFIALIGAVSAMWTGPLLELEREAVTDDLVEHINSLGTTWTAEKSARFEGKKLRDVQKLCGVIETPADEALPRKVFKKADKVDLPDSYDPREVHGDICPSLKHVRDQASCGSCWAFGGAESMTDRVCLASNGTDQTPISSEEITACCSALHSVHCFGDMGCNGGQIGDPWKYFEASGVVSGDLYGDDKWCAPYTLEPCEHHINGTRPPCHEGGATPKCTKECVAASGKTWDKDKHFGGKPYGIDGEDDLKQELYQHGPIEVAFTVYEDFPSYKSGVYQHETGAALGGHAVSMMGWGEDNGTPYWIVRNSWNDDWGNDGYFWILRGQDECGIEHGAASIPK